MTKIHLKHSWENPTDKLTFISGQILQQKFIDLEFKYKIILEFLKETARLQQGCNCMKAEKILDEIGE